MAESIKYKFGDSDLDLQTYIHNLEGNVSSYLENRAKKQGWNEGQIQEFRNSYNRYISALKDQYTNNTSRLHTDSLGTIHDSNGELSDTDQDDFYYNDKGEQLDKASFDALKKRKQRHYTGFAANKEVARFFQKVGQGVASTFQSNGRKISTEDFDSTKHGWNTWWGTVKNLDGGTNLKPYIDLDPVGADGKRAVTNRAKSAAGWVREYMQWLDEKNLKYDNHPIGYEGLKQRLETLATKWDDGKWDAEDLTAASQAGIGHDWTDKFFSTEADPSKTPEQIASEKAEAEQKARDAEAAAKTEAEEQAKKDFFNKHYNNYIASRGTYNDDNPYNIGTLPTFENMEAFRRTYAEGTNFNDIVKNWIANPWSNTPYSKKALWLILNGGQGHAVDLGDGVTYIPQTTDQQYGRGLIYDSNTGTLQYTFIGNIRPVWDKMVAKWRGDQNPEVRYQNYFKEGGVIDSFQLGGNFDYNKFMQEDREQGFQQRGQAKGRTAKQQEAGERLINSSHGNAQDQNAGFTGVEMTRLGAMAVDIASMITGIAGGNVASGLVGAGATALNFGADMNDDSISTWQATKNAAFGLGMDIVGAIPVFGATGKMAKMAKTAINLAPKVMMALGAYQGVAHAGEYYNSWKKLVDTNGKVSVDDWRNIAASIQLLGGGAAATARTIRRPKGDTEMVALDFKDKNKVKQTRVFTGNDAKEIKEAHAAGDLARLKRATTEKFDELKDLELDVRGASDGFTIPIWGKKIGAKEGGVDLLKVRQGYTGKHFVERDWHTPDTKMSDTKAPGKTITEIQDAQIEPLLRPLQAGSARMEGIMGRQASRVSELQRDITTKENDLATFDAAHPAPGRTQAEIQAELDAIAANRGAGDANYLAREAGQTTRKSSLQRLRQQSEAYRKGTSTDIKNKDVELARLRNDLKTRGQVINNLRQQLRVTTDPAARQAISNRIQMERTNIATLQQQQQRVMTERQNIVDQRKSIKERASKVQDKYNQEQQWLDANSTTRQGDLNTELSTRQIYDNNRKAISDPLQSLKDKLAQWQAYNSNSKSVQHQAVVDGKNNKIKLNPDGTVEFTLAGDQKVTRKWQDILDKYNIKYRRGGKFENGGVTNTQGNADWFENMYSSNAMQKWLKGFNATNYKEFNDLQDSWFANKNATGYDETKSNNTGVWSDGVKTRQQTWNSLGLNEGIGAAHTKGTLSGKGKDNAANEYTDGWFGKQEFIRHGGTTGSWNGKEEQLKQLQIMLEAQGLSYTPDANGMYKLAPLQGAAGTKTGEKPGGSQTGVAGDGKTDPKKPASPNKPGITETEQMVADRYAIPRLMLANHYNNRITDLAKNSARILDLTDPFYMHEYQMSDLDEEQMGHIDMGKLMSFASRPLTADGDKQNALMLDAMNSGLDRVREGMRKSNLRSRETGELVKQIARANDKSEHDTRQTNTAEINEGARKLLELEQMRLSKQHTNIDTKLQEDQFRALKDFQERDARQEAFVKSDIHNAVTYGLKDYAPDITDEELELWNQVVADQSQLSAILKDPNKSKLYMSAARKASQAEQDQLRQYYRIPSSKWSGIRSLATNPTDSDKLQMKGVKEPFAGSSEVAVGKDGTKIEMQKLRNKAKDEDRFHKNVQKHIDRNEKSLDRIAKYSRRKKK